MNVRALMSMLALATLPPLSMPAGGQQPADTIVRAAVSAPVAADTPRVRRHAIAYSDFYNTRLTIHRIGSYTMLPLFAGEWYLGDRLLNGTNPPSWMKPTHVGVAGALGRLVYREHGDGRVEPVGLSRAIPPDARDGISTRGSCSPPMRGFSGPPRSPVTQSTTTMPATAIANVALGSIGLSTLGTALMWFWKD